MTRILLFLLVICSTSSLVAQCYFEHIKIPRVALPEIISLRSVDPILLSTSGCFSEITTMGLFFPKRDTTTYQLYSDEYERKLKAINFVNQYIVSGYASFGSGYTTLTQQRLQRLPVRNINQVAGTIAGVDSWAGETPNIRGARAEGTAYFVDGVRVNSLP